MSFDQGNLAEQFQSFYELVLKLHLIQTEKVDSKAAVSHH